jgi:DNA-binding GntR family transcriptional regulator
MAFALDASLTSVKVSVAGLLREEILSDRLKPGEPIVEGKWAAKLKVARASVREAINILSAEGFVQKGLARTARVTAFSLEDVVQIYETRIALEGMAARLVATRKPDLSELDQVIADMDSAVQCLNVRTLRERDLAFHLLLCEKSGNRFLLEHLRRLIVPFFAFCVLRHKNALGDSKRGYGDHRRILEAVRSGDPDFAQREVAKIIQCFSEEEVGYLS